MNTQKLIGTKLIGSETQIWLIIIIIIIDQHRDTIKRLKNHIIFFIITDDFILFWESHVK